MVLLTNEKHRPLLLALIGALVFANSFWGRFVFDEYSGISQNDGIKHLWPPDYILTPPNDTRPVIGLSLAINYAMHGMHWWPYHTFNLIIHLTAALALYGIARRTLQSSRLRERFGADASRLAFFIALVWMVHPLQTASVTYIIQRCESMMGMFFLLTLYAVIRSDGDPQRRRWKVLAVACCALGMGCKQVMATAPVMVLLYDRTFLSGSIVASIRKRRWIYFWMCVSLLILLPSFRKPEGRATAGFGIEISPLQYALTQFGVIPHYLKLVVWPAVLCLDYVWPWAKSWRDVWPGLVLIQGVLALTAVGLVRNRPWAFLGAWFFVILAPSSSILPINDPIFEHRMYLSLAALAAGFVLLLDWALRRWAAARSPWGDERKGRLAMAWLLGIVCCALSIRTIVRNDDYSSEARIWKKVLDVYPNSERAMQNYGDGLAKAGEHEKALFWFLKLYNIQPSYADGAYNVGVEYAALGNREEALAHYARALELNSGYPRVHTFMGDLLREEHRDEDALEHYEAELRRDPRYTNAHFGLGMALAELGDSAAALPHLQRTLELDENYPEVHYKLGEILLELHRKDEAIGHFEAVLRRDPHNEDAARELARARAKVQVTGAMN